jgi:hypothetical protein
MSPPFSSSNSQWLIESFRTLGSEDYLQHFVVDDATLRLCFCRVVQSLTWQQSGKEPLCRTADFWKVQPDGRRSFFETGARLQLHQKAFLSETSVNDSEGTFPSRLIGWVPAVLQYDNFR